MRHDADRGRLHHGFRLFLRDEALLVSILGISLVLVLFDSFVRASYAVPQLRLVLATIFVLAGGLVALLTATRFAVERRHFDLLLCGGFLATSVATLGFTIAPAVVSGTESPGEAWAGVATRTAGWVLIAVAPHAHGRATRTRAELWGLVSGLTITVAVLTFVSGSVAGGLALLGTSRVALVVAVATALVGFANRYRVLGEDLDRWLAFGATLMLFALLNDVFTPSTGLARVSQGDFFRLLGYSVLLVGVWRAMRASEFGRAVAEERARVARDIHDGLAQYLFVVSTHISLLEAGADPVQTLPQLKEAALAAQREARFAVLALSTAAGSAPFDAALRRYIDVLTADGGFEVELDIDRNVQLAPDEQIEIFRIVQEGLANARRHANAERAWVTVRQRGADRLVVVRDDGHGFDANHERGAGQGLRNIRERAATIGGALSLASAPGRGTALEVVLRPS